MVLGYAVFNINNIIHLYSYIYIYIYIIKVFLTVKLMHKSRKKSITNVGNFIYEYWYSNTKIVGTYYSHSRSVDCKNITIIMV